MIWPGLSLITNPTTIPGSRKRTGSIAAPPRTRKDGNHSLVDGPYLLLLEVVRQAERADDEQREYAQRQRSHLLDFHRRLALILSHHHRT